ncbi:lipid A 1-phosphatase [Aliiroseovarius halocynthiae]|uniref:Phosphatase PAP2 family protein n=1 Tax=Aliiroseovarius halocynthiae TaxID=985055 RepID=A0A545SPT8_9RHOB|nr:phosphatase PAP2 family protein [Aliiroseovarius halocynthiae]TQV66876.1 phosphatase PAP2 family protein [Aliiroseovarius halocynthiae]SMR82282.1 lipid A 1-phosphatase [Aliiroseovarius halocynthiae]
MTFREIFQSAGAVLHAYPIRFALVMMLILASMFYPTNLERDYQPLKNGHEITHVVAIEDYGRHLNSIVPLAIALVSRDVVGLKQILVVTVAGIVATHGPKRMLNDVTIQGTRLGQRPISPDSQHNTPSGHSALAASGAMIMLRRYSIWLGMLGLVVTFLTMYGRYMLDKHTVSATIAGTLIGGTIAVLFVTKRQH